MKENAAYYVHMKDFSCVRLAKIELKQPIPILDFECFILSSPILSEHHYFPDYFYMPFYWICIYIRRLLRNAHFFLSPMYFTISIFMQLRADQTSLHRTVTCLRNPSILPCYCRLLSALVPPLFYTGLIGFLFCSLFKALCSGPQLC